MVAPDGPHPILPRGEYWADTVASHQQGGVLLTVCVYPENSRIPLHSHEHSGLFLLIKGQHREECRSRDIQQSPLTVLWHDAREAHATHVGQGGMLGLNISIHSSWLASLEIDPNGIDAIALENSPIVRSRAIAMLVAARAGKPVEDLVLDALSAAVPTPDETHPTWFREAVEYVLASYREPLSTSAIAAQVGIHPIHLARTFRRLMGTSITEYVQVLRLLEALRLIVDQGTTIAEAAAQAGFSDQAHLARLARRFWGQPMREIKAILRSNVGIVQGA